MENTNGKNIGDVLSLIESQSLKCKINSNNKYPIVFKDIGVTKYSFINEYKYFDLNTILILM